MTAAAASATPFPFLTPHRKDSSLMSSLAVDRVGVSFTPVTISRRVALTGLLAVAAGAATAVVLAHPLGDTAPSLRTTVGTGTIAAARADAVASVGKRAAGSAWQLATGAVAGTAWAAAFASWLVRDALVTPTTNAQALFDSFERDGAVGTVAKAGSLIFYHDVNGAVLHVGFVDEVFGQAVMTIEGDVPGDLGHENTFVRRYGHPRSDAISYGYPRYAD